MDYLEWKKTALLANVALLDKAFGWDFRALGEGVAVFGTDGEKCDGRRRLSALEFESVQWNGVLVICGSEEGELGGEPTVIGAEWSERGEMSICGYLGTSGPSCRIGGALRDPASSNNTFPSGFPLEDTNASV